MLTVLTYYEKAIVIASTARALILTRKGSGDSESRKSYPSSAGCRTPIEGRSLLFTDGRSAEKRKAA